MTNLTQKICEKCGKRAIKVEKNRLGMRTCECGHKWYPQKVKK